jgi:hypothetical protein
VLLQAFPRLPWRRFELRDRRLADTMLCKQDGSGDKSPKFAVAAAVERLCVCSVLEMSKAARSEVRAVDVGLGSMQVRCKWLA